MLKIVTTILCVYMLVRCVLPLRCKRPLKMLLALLVLLVGFRLHIFSLLYATFNPELPRWILVSTGVPHVLFFLLALLSLLRDGVCLIWWLARRLRPGLPALPGSNRQMAALLLVALVMTVMAVPAALRIPDVRTQEIVLPGLPPALDGLEPTGAALQSLYPISKGGDVQLFGREHLLSRYFELQSKKKEILEKIGAIENTIKADMGEAERGDCGIYCVSWKSQTRRTFQAQEFTKAHPEIDLEPFYKQSTARPFKVKVSEVEQTLKNVG